MSKVVFNETLVYIIRNKTTSLATAEKYRYSN